MNVIELLEGTIYEPDAECIARVFKRRGVVDEKTLANAPRLLGSLRICGHEMFPLLEEIRRVLSGEPKLSYTEDELALLDAREAVASLSEDASAQLEEVSEEEE